jgi:ABC-type transport system involved in cytochrome bd biosynthesis fused ATPase/permease subunit
MIEERAGKGLDIFILDEPFDGLDSICREQCLQILQTHVSGKRIVIVDHSNETKELVHDRIIVVRDGQESRIVLDCDQDARQAPPFRAGKDSADDTVVHKKYS